MKLVLLMYSTVTILRLRSLHIHSALSGQGDHSGSCAYSGQLQITNVAKNQRDLWRIRSRFPAVAGKYKSDTPVGRESNLCKIAAIAAALDDERATMINRVVGRGAI